MWRAFDGGNLYIKPTPAIDAAPRHAFPLTGGKIALRERRIYSPPQSITDGGIGWPSFTGE
jgi:hypothetical protein